MATYKEVTFATIIKGAFFDNKRLRMYSDEAHTLPIDLSGATIVAELKTNPKSIAQAIWSTEDDTITISGTDNNFINLVGRALNIPAATYYSDVYVSFANGTPRKYVRFKLTIIDTYTNG